MQSLAAPRTMWRTNGHGEWIDRAFRVRVYSDTALFFTAPLPSCYLRSRVLNILEPTRLTAFPPPNRNRGLTTRTDSRYLTSQENSAPQRFFLSWPDDIPSMSFGFPIGDLIALVNLAREIAKNCIDIAGAPKSHQDFRNAARHLQTGLEQIVGVISERNKLAKIDAKPGFHEHPNDHATFSALRDITSDFGKTLETIQLRLKQYPINGTTGIERRFWYWVVAEDEIKELIDRCGHHIITINFLLEPFKT